MTVNFQLVRNPILTKACRMAGILEAGEQMDNEMLQSSADHLNMISKELEAFEKKLWSIDRVEIQLPVSSVVSHNGSIYYCLKTHTSSPNNEPGIGLGWRDFWYGSDAVESSPVAWALDVDYIRGGEIATPAGTASIESITIREDDTDFPVPVINRFKEMKIPFKWEVDRPEKARFDYDRQLLTFYYLPDKPYTVIYDRLRILEDITVIDDNLDIPSSLYSYLIYELAARMAEEYGQEDIKIRRLEGKAQVRLALISRKQVEYTDCETTEPIF